MESLIPHKTGYGLVDVLVPILDATTDERQKEKYTEKFIEFMPDAEQENAVMILKAFHLNTAVAVIRKHNNPPPPVPFELEMGRRHGPAPKPM